MISYISKSRRKSVKDLLNLLQRIDATPDILKRVGALEVTSTVNSPEQRKRKQLEGK